MLVGLVVEVGDPILKATMPSLMEPTRPLTEPISIPQQLEVPRVPAVDKGKGLIFHPLRRKQPLPPSRKESSLVLLLHPLFLKKKRSPRWAACRWCASGRVGERRAIGHCPQAFWGYCLRGASLPTFFIESLGNFPLSVFLFISLFFIERGCSHAFVPLRFIGGFWATSNELINGFLELQPLPHQLPLNLHHEELYILLFRWIYSNHICNIGRE